MVMNKYPRPQVKSLRTIARNSLFGFFIIALLGVSGLVTTPSIAAGSFSIECMDPPTIKEVVPNVGSPDGGETVDIFGTCFERGATVSFDTSDAKVAELSAERITVTVPKHDPGVVDISVTNPGQRPIVLEKGYTYQDSRLKSVTYNANGGTGTLVDGRSPYETGSTVEVLKPEGINRDGYNFVNWNTQSDGRGTKYNPGESFKIEENTTLYAMWEVISPTVYTVTFNGNGAISGSMSPQSSSVPANLSSNLYSRTGYTFAGWNTVAGGGGTAYADGATYSFAANVTLYAQWTLIPVVFHTVTFNGNGATGGSTDSQTASSSTALRLNGFTKTGYTFDSWNTQATGGGATYSNGASYDFAADITLYARWTTLPLHTITFNANGGSGSMAPQSSSVAFTISANTFTRSGFNFVGWMTNPTGGIHYEVGDIYPFTSDLTLYAEWSAIIVPPTNSGGGSGPVVFVPVTHVVIFNGNGATGGSMATQSSDKAVPLNKLAFTRPGYNFDHWSTTPDIDGTLFQEQEIFPFYTDTTLYAHWSPRVLRQVTFSSNGPAITSVTFQTSLNPAALIPNTVIRSGFNFLGWNTASNGSGIAFSNGATYSFNFDLHLFAQWARIPLQSSTVSLANPLILPLATNQALNLNLSILKPDGTTTPTIVQIPQGLVGIDASIRITPVATVESLQLGLVSLQVEVLDVFGAAIPEMNAPLTMQLANVLGDYNVAQSSDGIIWTPLPLLNGTTLSAGQLAGYFYDADGFIVVITSHLTQFGLRKQQSSLFAVAAPAQAIPLNSFGRLLTSGGSGSGPVIYKTTSPNICTVSEVGIVKATSTGICNLAAIKGGDAIYLNSDPAVFSIYFGMANRLLAISGSAPTQSLNITLGLAYAAKVATIQVKLPGATTFSVLSTKKLGAKGQVVVPVNVPLGTTIQISVAAKVVASLKVAS